MPGVRFSDVEVIELSFVPGENHPSNLDLHVEHSDDDDDENDEHYDDDKYNVTDSSDDDRDLMRENNENIPPTTTKKSKTWRDRMSSKSHRRKAKDKKQQQQQQRIVRDSAAITLSWEAQKRTVIDLDTYERNKLKSKKGRLRRLSRAVRKRILRNSGAETSDTDESEDEHQRHHRQQYAKKNKKKKKKETNKNKKKKKKTFMRRLSKSKSIERFASEASSGGESGGSSTDLAPRAPRRVDNAPTLPSRRQQQQQQQNQRMAYTSSDDDEEFDEEGRENERIVPTHLSSDDAMESSPLRQLEGAPSSPPLPSKYEDSSDDDANLMEVMNSSLNEFEEKINIFGNNGREAALLGKRQQKKHSHPNSPLTPRRMKRSSMEHVTRAIGVIAKQPVKLAKQPVKLAKSTKKRFHNMSKSPLTKRKSRTSLDRGSNHHNKGGEDEGIICGPVAAPLPLPIIDHSEDESCDDVITTFPPPPPCPPVRQASDDLPSCDSYSDDGNTDRDQTRDPIATATPLSPKVVRNIENVESAWVSPIRAAGKTNDDEIHISPTSPPPAAVIASVSPGAYSPKRFSFPLRPPARFSTNRSAQDITPIRPPRRLRNSYPEASPKQSDPLTPTRSRRSSIGQVTHAMVVLAKQPYKLAKQPVKLAKSTRKHIRKRVEDRRTAANNRSDDSDDDYDENWIDQEYSPASKKKKHHRKKGKKKEMSSEDEDDAVIVRDGSGAFVLPTPPVYQSDSEDEGDPGIQSKGAAMQPNGENCSMSSGSSESSVVEKQRKRRTMYNVAKSIGKHAIKQPVKLAKQPVKLAKSTTKRIRKAAKRSKRSTHKDAIDPVDDNSSDDDVALDIYSDDENQGFYPDNVNDFEVSEDYQKEAQLGGIVGTGGYEVEPSCDTSLDEKPDEIGNDIVIKTDRMSIDESQDEFFPEEEPHDLMEGIDGPTGDDVNFSPPPYTDASTVGMEAKIEAVPDKPQAEKYSIGSAKVDTVGNHRMNGENSTSDFYASFCNGDQVIQFNERDEISALVENAVPQLDMGGDGDFRNTSRGNLLSPQLPKRRRSNDGDNLNDPAPLFETYEEYNSTYNDEYSGSQKHLNGGSSRDLLSPNLPKRRLSNGSERVDYASNSPDVDYSYDDGVVDVGDLKSKPDIDFRRGSDMVSSPAVPQRYLSDSSIDSETFPDDDDDDCFSPPKERCHSHDDYVLQKTNSISRFDQVFEKPQRVQRHSSMPMHQISRVSMLGEVFHSPPLSKSSSTRKVRTTTKPASGTRSNSGEAMSP